MQARTETVPTNNFRLAVELLSWIAAAGLLVALAVNLREFLHVGFWRHDAMYYLPSYYGKLGEEGRWINYFLSPLLRRVPPLLAIAGAFACLFQFCYTAARRLSADRLASLLFALIAVQIPSLYLQVLWPATSLPSFLVLLASVWVADRLPPWVYFPLFALLFFATMSHLYFLLPLLFLRDIDRPAAVRLLLLWMVSFPLAFGVTELVTHWITGQFIEIAQWRGSRAVATLTDLRTNATHSLRSCIDASRYLVGFVGVPVALVALATGLHGRRFGRDALAVLVIACAALAVYVTAIPLGLEVATRTALVYFVCVLFFVLVKRAYTDMGKCLLLLVAVLVGGQLAVTSHRTINWYATVTSTLRDALARALPGDVNKDTRVYIAMSPIYVARLMQKIEYCRKVARVVGEDLNDDYRFEAALRELGVHHIDWCDGCLLDGDVLQLQHPNCSADMFAYRPGKARQVILSPTQAWFR